MFEKNISKKESFQIQVRTNHESHRKVIESFGAAAWVGPMI